MKITDLINSTDQKEIIEKLKKGRGEQPDVEAAKKALDPLQHDVFDPVKRPDKKVRIDAEDGGNKILEDPNAETGYRSEPVARIAIALQKLIVKRAVAFLFGNEIELEAEPENDKQKLILKALKRMLYDSKSKSLNRKVARQVMSCKEVAELWYPVEKKHSNYGFDSNYQIRVAVFSPLLGDKLYPYFDKTGDMIAFSREFSQIDEEGNTKNFFETYTDVEHVLWQEGGASGVEIAEGFPKKIEIGKIPVVFGTQLEFEWADVQVLIDRLEKLLSNFGDTNDYHASPKIFVTGTIEGFAKKGESGAIIQGDADSTAEYLAWQHAPESVKLEIETLLRLIYTLTQTPDISFESIKGIGAVSGVALKLMFMDAHLKVEDHKEVFDEYMQRRLNILKAFLSKFNTGLAADCEALFVEPIITPYMIDDAKSLVDMLSTASGGKPVISQKRAVELAGLANDTDAEFAQIEAEAAKDNSYLLGEPTE